MIYWKWFETTNMHRNHPKCMRIIENNTYYIKNHRKYKKLMKTTDKQQKHTFSTQNRCRSYKSIKICRDTKKTYENVWKYVFCVFVMIFNEKTWNMKNTIFVFFNIFLIFDWNCVFSNFFTLIYAHLRWEPHDLRSFTLRSLWFTLTYADDFNDFCSFCNNFVFLWVFYFFLVFQFFFEDFHDFL